MHLREKKTMFTINQASEFLSNMEKRAEAIINDC